MGQYPVLKVRQGKIADRYFDKIIIDTSGKIVFYGYAGIQPTDSTKFYRYKYLEFVDSMNITRGRKSARYEDSATKYYKLLYKKP